MKRLVFDVLYGFPITVCVFWQWLLLAGIDFVKDEQSLGKAFIFLCLGVGLAYSHERYLNRRTLEGTLKKRSAVMLLATQISVNVLLVFIYSYFFS